jgi:hypothetical protein
MASFGILYILSCAYLKYYSEKGSTGFTQWHRCLLTSCSLPIGLSRDHHPQPHKCVRQEHWSAGWASRGFLLVSFLRISLFWRQNASGCQNEMTKIVALEFTRHTILSSPTMDHTGEPAPGRSPGICELPLASVEIH